MKIKIFIALFFVFIGGIISYFYFSYFHFSYFYFSYDRDYYFAWEIIDDKYKNNLKDEFSFSFLKVYKIILYKYRYNTYIPCIESKLYENGIPSDFKYLAIVESSLDNRALSNKWALWIRQFMPETWKDFWLEIDDSIDERLDFYKSTDAAIYYLKELYEQFWSWPLVAASYNRWETAIQKALEEQGVDNYYDLDLNEETGRFVYKIIWVKDIFE